MPWTIHEPKNLRRRQNKVEDLRHKEEEQRLGEVSEDADDGERHASEIAEGVADKRPSWIPFKL